MTIKILGSGGCTPIPKPLCKCKICSQAQELGIPYYRTGSSIYIKELNAIFDTSCDIKQQILREKLIRVKSIFYSHWHPDHTNGLRIVEQINSNFLRKFIDKKKPENKISIYALKNVINDILKINNKYSSCLSFYEKEGYIDINNLYERKSLKLDNFKITAISVNNICYSSIFIIENNSKKIIYAPCNIKPFPIDEKLLRNADVLILGKILPKGKLKDNYIIPKDNILMNDIFTIEEALKIKKELNIKQIVGTHIEEEFNRSYDDYKEIEESLNREIIFAYDGMKIDV